MTEHVYDHNVRTLHKAGVGYLALARREGGEVFCLLAAPFGAVPRGFDQTDEPEQATADIIRRLMSAETAGELAVFAAMCGGQVIPGASPLHEGEEVEEWATEITEALRSWWQSSH